MVVSTRQLTDWSNPSPMIHIDQYPGLAHYEPTIADGVSATARPKRVTLPTADRAFEVTKGNGVYVFPSGMPETYYVQLLDAITRRTAELHSAYPKGKLWREFEAPDHPPLAEYTLTDEELIRPLEALWPHIVEQLRPQIDPVYQACDTEFITVRWYTGAACSLGSFFKFNPVKRRLELFRYGRKPFVEIHVDPGKSIVSTHTCHIKFCITLIPTGPNGAPIADHASDIGTLYDPLGCRRATGRWSLQAADLVATPTMNVVCFLTTRGASAFNQLVKRRFPAGSTDFIPAKGVKHRAAEQRAPLLAPQYGEPFAPRVLLHGGVHLRRATTSNSSNPLTG